MGILKNVRPPTEDERQAMEKAFSNKFHYSLSNKYTLDSTSEVFAVPYWSDTELLSWKENLNEVKGQLDDKDIDKWQEHTQRTHRGAGLMRLIRSEYRLKMGTQAWFKFHEILGHYPWLVSGDSDGFNSVHLCEAPGAFVASLKYYLENRGLDANWKWVGTTLNPYYEGNDFGIMIDEDSYIRDSRPNWYFGADDTGNVMDKQNILHLKKVCKERGLERVHLVTCDGSIDCANNPGEQEAIVSQLIYCEVVAALHLLTTSGSLVVKMFTLFEHTSICILFLLCGLFKEVNVIKPVTSKPGNSEVYVVACNFQGIDDELIDRLFDHIGAESPLTAIFAAEHISESFLAMHRDCCRRFYDSQIKAIEMNLKLFDKIPDNFEPDIIEQFAKYFCDRFGLKKAEGSYYEPRTEKKGLKRKLPPTAGGKNRHQGTLTSRQLDLKRSPAEWVTSVAEFEITTDSAVFGRLIKKDNDSPILWPDHLCPVVGRTYSVLRSSKFCDRKILGQYLKLLGNIKELKDYMDNPEVILLHAFKKSNTVFGSNFMFLVHPEEFNSIQSHVNIRNLHVKVSSELSRNEAFDSVVFCGLLLKPPREREMEKIVDVGEEISELARIFEKITPGQHCLISVGPLLTRLRAGLLYIVYSCFEKAYVFMGSSSSTVFIAGVTFAKCPPSLEGCLDLALSPSSGLLSSGQSLLELIPMDMLYSKKFYDSLLERNNEFVQMRFNHLLRLQREICAATAETTTSPLDHRLGTFPRT